jgi:uncharacterized membrane protein
MKRLRHVLVLSAFLSFLVVPALALAGPRSGGSFSGRGGFRSSGSSYSRGYAPGRPVSGRGTSVVMMPGFGWGFLPFGLGGGFSLLGTMMMIGVLGFGAVLVARALRRAHRQSPDGHWHDDHDDYHGAPAVAPGRAYVYRLQLGLGRSARGIQKRLEAFAASGDTATEVGLAHLLAQTALELMREKDAIRYGAAESHGPMSLTNGETKMNALALNERSRFQVERVRGADGKVRRSDEAATESPDVLEYLLVSVLVATRIPLPALKELTDREQLDSVLAELGGLSPDSLLGVEVIWTPADPGDALTETDLLISHPHLRGL